MTIQKKRNTALTILDTIPSGVVIVHYDSTTRNRLNGDWSWLIIKMSNWKKFRLRSLNKAIEDRKKIVNYSLASLSRLALTINYNKEELWMKITAVVTDSVEKNLKIEGLIAVSLSSKHIFLHVLCVSHTWEAFDCGNLLVLRHVEEKPDLKGKVVNACHLFDHFCLRETNCRCRYIV